MNKHAIAFTFSCLLASPLFAFDIDGTKWPGGNTEFYVSIPGTSPSGLLWNTAFIDAMENWNQSTRFKLNLVEELEDPCRFDSRNGVGFTSDVCGSAFGSNTLAVTLTRFSSQILGPPAIIRSDIVINEAVRYDIFDGRLVQAGIPFGSVDFRRVALHELGHALGLDHETSADAIMAPNISNIDSLQVDDIAGVNTLYGGLDNCSIRPLNFGTSSNALNGNDCTVVDLTVGGTDTSFIDLYRFNLDAPATVSFEMNSTELDSVLIIATTDLDYLAFDDKSSGLCSSSLTTNLPAGNYFVLGNTYVDPPKTECGNTGDYVLEASFESSVSGDLGASVSLLGAASNGSFSGGISADNGLSFGNRFASTSSLDIEATISVDSLHIGQDGFLVAGATIGETVLFLNANGNFEEASTSEFIKARSITLADTQDLVLARDLIPANLGIDNIEVNFWVGYGLDSQPQEIFFHQQPINLVITP
ncbi:MAG: matrixin family metalloprotease [Pseudohongiellaceae bacterium]